MCYVRTEVGQTTIKILQGSDASEIYVKKFICQEAFLKGEYQLPCADGTPRLLSRSRPSSTVDGNLEREDDCEIEDGDIKESKSEESWSMSGEFIYRHHEELRLKRYDSDIQTFLIPLKYVDVMRQTQTNIKSRNTRGELCSGRTTPKTKKDTQQYSQSKVTVLQRLRWQRQICWTLSQSFLVVAGEPQVTQFLRTLNSK